MSIREKVAALLFGSKPKAGAEEGEAQAQMPVETGPARESAMTGSFGSTAVELPNEHPIYQLHELRRKEYGYLPQPRLVLDEDGVLSEEVVQREGKRAKTFLTSVCAARLKEATGKGKRKTGNKKKQEDDLEEDEGPPPLDAQVCFFLSVDKLYAWALVLPPVHGGFELSRDILCDAMVMEGVTFGVDARLVDRLSHDDRKYFTLFLIAKGKPAFDGKNGNIVEHFPREVQRILEVDDYNQVDYTALNLIHNVKQGEEICRLIRPTEGEPGRTVLDEVIPAKGGVEVPLPKGRNTEISEDELSLVASISGHVEFTGRSFQVKPVLDIAGDVDFSTGDINFLGDVNIAGDVLSGFTVRAMGNIHVDGVLEAGCSVEAGGDLVVVKGILGEGETLIRSHRSVFSKYIENATLHVRENLQTDCIINGNIYCDGEVVVKSGRGTIIGGRIWAAKKIAANVIGAPSECRNIIVLGGTPCANFEREQLRKEMKELEVELEKLECQPDSQVKANLIQKTQAKLSVVEMKLRHLEADAALQVDPYALDTGRMECGIAYAGTEITFENEVVRLHRETRQCVANVINGEIAMM